MNKRTDRLPFAAAHTGLRLAVRVTPHAASDRIIGLVPDGHGSWYLKAAVAAPPSDGKANAALVQLLARQLGLRPSDLAIARGTASRSKVVTVLGDAVALTIRLTEGLRPWLTQD